MSTQPSHDPLLATAADVLREALGGVDGILAAFVFGSMVRGDTRPDSDVDVLVVAEDVPLEVMGGALLEAESLLGREVDVKRYTPDALARKARGGFLREVLAGPRVWLVGSEDVLRTLLPGLDGWTGEADEATRGGPPACVDEMIRGHLARRRLEARFAEDDELLALWGRARRAHRDALATGLSLHSRFLAGCEAGDAAARALVRAAGYRTRGGEAYRYVTYEVAQSVAVALELKYALEAMDALRALRYAVEYEAEDDLDEAGAERAIGLAGRIIDLGARELGDARPELAGRLKKVGQIAA